MNTSKAIKKFDKQFAKVEKAVSKNKLPSALRKTSTLLIIWNLISLFIPKSHSKIISILEKLKDLITKMIQSENDKLNI